MWRRLVVTASLFLLPMQAGSEPGLNERWLMNTPVSLWDFGLYKLGLMVEEHANRAYPDSIPYVDYNWEENRIIIGLVFSGGNFSSELCRNVVNSIKVRGGYIIGRGLVLKKKQSFYSENFSRKFTTPDEPDDYFSKIDKIIKIKVEADNKYCESMLMSDKILFSE